MKPVVVFRHAPTEGPGYFATFLDEHRIAWRLVRLDAGEAVPAEASAFAGLAFMGGPMSANDDLPWTAPVLELMRDAARRGVPVIGHCLGGQLLAKALGGEVTRNPVKEIGWHRVEVEDSSEAREWLGGDLRAFTGEPAASRTADAAAPARDDDRLASETLHDTSRSCAGLSV